MRASLRLNIPEHPVTASDAAPCHRSHTTQPKTQAQVLLNLAPVAMAAPGTAATPVLWCRGPARVAAAVAGTGWEHVCAWTEQAEELVAANADPRGNAEYSAGWGGVAPEKR